MFKESHGVSYLVNNTVGGIMKYHWDFLSKQSVCWQVVPNYTTSLHYDSHTLICNKAPIVHINFVASFIISPPA